MSSSSYQAKSAAGEILSRPALMLMMCLALLVLGSSPIHALPTVFPGNQCQPAKADVGKIGYGNTFIQNESSTASARIFCPLAFDFGTISTEHDTLRITVNTVDRNPTANISCTALATDNDTGGVIWNGGSKSTTGTGDIGDLRWEIPLQTDQRIFGAYAVMCTLPLAPTASQRSALRTITVFAIRPLPPG